MKIADLAPAELARRLRSREGLCFRCGPVINCLRSPLGSIAEGFATAYADFPLDDSGYADFHVRVAPPKGLRAHYRPQALFYLDGISHFEPLPLPQAYPMLEWGLNWCVTSQCHHLLILHAAVVEKNGRALILPGEPGAGKSTLTAALTLLGGWRLLSDELALIVPATGMLLSIPRPISLKNASLDLVRGWGDGIVMTEPVRDTGKGTVGHVRPPPASVARMDVPAVPGWVVFPRYRQGAATRLSAFSQGQTVLRLIEQSFNYQLHGEAGFEALAELVSRCGCFEFEYSNIDEALAAFDRLATDSVPKRQVVA